MPRGHGFWQRIFYVQTLNKVALVTGHLVALALRLRAHLLNKVRRSSSQTSMMRRTGSGARAGRAGHVSPFDVRLETHWQAMMAELEQRFQRLDVLVNKCGDHGFEDGFRAHDPEHASLVDWRAVHATNLDGCFLGCCRDTRHAASSQGFYHQYFIALRLGRHTRCCGLCVFESGDRNHSKTVVLYCAEQGLAIRCNSIHPAAILTPWGAAIG